MGDDNDFTFCQVGVNVDQNHVEVPSAVLDIGGVAIKDDLLGSSGNHKMFSVEKGNSSENGPVQNQGKVGSLAFTVVDMSTTKPSTELPKKVVPSNVKDPAMSPEEQLISTRKPIVRTKVPFEKGYSQMDWLKLTRTHPDLAGLKGASNKRIISMDEVKQHRAEGSIWTVLKGRVYNITPYMNFHPGGVDMLLKAAGKDCTSLFNKYHAWVNADFLLEKCLVGTLDESR